MQRAFVTGGSGFIGSGLVRALRARGVAVCALARSPRAAAHVEGLGAEPVFGDLENPAALAKGMQGCDVVFHAAANLSDWDLDADLRINVKGTELVLRTAVSAQVARVVYVSGTGVLIGSGPVVDASEDLPCGKPVGALSASRVRSETTVRAGNGAQLETVVVRLPYVWGPGDTLRPQLRAALRAGQYFWISRGDHLISTCHIDNAVAGLLAAAEHGRPGALYHLADGAPLKLRTFITEQMRVEGLVLPDRSIPFWVAKVMADGLFALSRVFRVTPAWLALSPTFVRFLGQQITIDDSCARRELGYRPTIDWQTGLSQLIPHHLENVT